MKRNPNRFMGGIEGNSSAITRLALRNRQPGGDTVLGGVNVNTVQVTVTTTDWTADNALYKDAPLFGTMYYADINHGLGSIIAHAVCYRDAEGFLYTDFMYQQPQDLDVLRVWLQKAPSYDILVLVLA